MIDLTAFIPHVPAWLMVLSRFTGLFIFAPVFGSQTIPGRVKVFLAIGLSLCVYPMLLDPRNTSAALLSPLLAGQLHLWTLIPALAMELVIGLALGYGASLPLMAVQVGGHVIDQQIGLGLAGVFNPELNEQSGIVGEFFFMMAIAIFLILGGHRVLIVTLAGSFQHIPPGGFADFGGLVRLMLGLLTVMFELAMKVAGPLLCIVFLETVAMGFIARTVPQMNILSVGFALRIIVGVGFVIVTVGVVGGVTVDTMQLVLRRLTGFFAL
jgi:flagellar biosynthetic protein FliR